LQRGFRVLYLQAGLVVQRLQGFAVHDQAFQRSAFGGEIAARSAHLAGAMA
jgi:hypothetical protein